MEMSRNEIKARLGEVIKMAMPNIATDPAEMPDTASLTQDVGLTSVGVLYIVIAIEEFFGIRFDDVGFGDLKTVGEVVDYVEKKLLAK
jgi:acyl carrier protein